jgi:hypothetical protein
LGRIGITTAASWFETRGVAALLTMRVQDLILMRRANGSRECAPDDRLRAVSKDEARIAGKIY